MLLYIPQKLPHQVTNIFSKAYNDIKSEECILVALGSLPPRKVTRLQCYYIISSISINNVSVIGGRISTITKNGISRVTGC
jgi:hypothetical protein